MSFDLQSPEGLARSIAEWSLILNKCAAHETMFSDFSRGCDGLCSGTCRDISPACAKTKEVVAAAVAKPDALTWKVWRKKEGEYIDLVGILRLERINPGCDAVAHYFFWDKRLKDKEGLLNAWWTWLTTDSEFWIGLKRVTLEIPSHAYALAAHAQRKLGFGGPYVYKHQGRKSRKLQVEGVKENAFLWRGKWRDMIHMGRTIAKEDV